eukprot:CAMPEP_0119137430 /NCGR_PEP_ID=MMETSP1310-20130426/23589_1 /TAXON_ID=464262 /ORGANISM="Genus nov. species nov., Strain RCC2339" /LENGTH=282 /DNA_ID=CAMNT_0007128517 /DNA_START=14 /DNA_END=860 /DNA_ORIENTATION=-
MAFCSTAEENRLDDDMEEFLKSETCLQFEKFLTRTSKPVQSKKLSDEVHVSPVLERLIGVLEEMEVWLQEIPPIQQPMRYGNKAFRDYGDRLRGRAEDLMGRIFGDALPQAGRGELGVYFAESFGNTTRIDYGTGHETNFLAFLFCMEILGFVGAGDYAALILRVFARYIRLVRHIQKTYMLEPAGSHGVWSLDDYQFLPFYYGAAQLMGQKGLSPKVVLDDAMREAYKHEYLYFAAIDFIFEMKTGPFAEHSPILYDMAQVKLWSKLNGGLLRMYRDEVLK